MTGKKTAKNSKYHDLFEEGQIEGLFGSLETSIEAFVQGPLVKTQATYDYEYIIKMLLLKKNVTFSVENNEYWVEIENDKKFNLSEVLKNFNASHLYIDEKDHLKYIDYLKNESDQKPKKDKSFGEEDWPTEAYFNTRDKDNELANLSYAEKCAINIYTQNYFTTMNAILRGNVYIDPKHENFQNEMLEVLLHNGFSASGLNKVGDTQVKNAFRVDRKLPKELIDEKINSINNDEELIVEKGFVSTSKDKPTPIAGVENPLFKGNVRKGMVFTVFNNMIGKNIASISSESKEREMLIPPGTQVKYKKYKQQNDETYLYADIVRTPTLNQTPGKAYELSSQDLILEEKMQNEITNDVSTEEVDKLLDHVKNLKKNYESQKWKFYTDPERKEQISRLMLKANKISVSTKITPKEKIVQITEALLSVKNELDAKQNKKSTFLKIFASKSRLSKNINESLEILSEKSKNIYNSHQSEQNLFEYNNPLFDESMKDIINHVHIKYLSQPYRDVPTMNTGEHEYINNETNQVVNRPNHATVHTLRGALMVPVILEFYKKHADKKEFNQLGLDDIKRMQIAMLFSTVGRQCEDNKNYTKYRNDSATAFKEYCQENCKELFSEKQIKEYATYLKRYTDPAETRKYPKAEIMRMAHSLDVLRYQPNEVKFNYYCKNELSFKLGDGPAEALVSYSRQCLIATGNRIRTSEQDGKGQRYNPKIFTEASLDPDKALIYLSKVAPPKDLSKPKFKI